jgi:hypothetical protein
MNYQKLDANLVLALDEVSDTELVSLVVFIYTETNLNSTATAVLENLGVSGVSREQDLFTATLSPDQIAQLSDLPWVRLIRRSQKLHLRCRNF